MVVGLAFCLFIFNPVFAVELAPNPQVDNVLTLTNNAPTCASSKMLLRIVDILLKMLGEDPTKADQIANIRELINIYVQTHPEGSEYEETDADADTVILEDDNVLRMSNIYSIPTGKMNTKISFKYELPSIDHPHCKDSFLKLLQVAYDKYVELAKYPKCYVGNDNGINNPFDPFNRGELNPIILQNNPKFDQDPHKPTYSYDVILNQIKQQVPNSDDLISIIESDRPYYPNGKELPRIDVPHGSNPNKINILLKILQMTPDSVNRNTILNIIKNMNINDILKSLPSNPLVNIPQDPNLNFPKFDNLIPGYPNPGFKRKDIMPKVNSFDKINYPRDTSLNIILEMLLNKKAPGPLYENNNNINPIDKSPQSLDILPGIIEQPYPINGLPSNILNILQQNLLDKQPNLPSNKDISPNQNVVPDFQNLSVFLNEMVVRKLLSIYGQTPPPLQINNLLLKYINELIRNPSNQNIDFSKLLNYDKDHIIRGEIPNLQDLLGVTNPYKLETLPNKGVIELTYLLNKPELLVQPIYFVKYQIPYSAFVVNARNLIKQKPHLTTNPHQLYQELIAISNVSEISPDLKGYPMEELIKLTYKNGELIKAQLIQNDNDELNQKLKIIQDLNSNIGAEDILKINQNNELNYYKDLFSNTVVSNPVSSSGLTAALPPSPPNMITGLGQQFKTPVSDGSPLIKDKVSYSTKNLVEKHQ